MVAWHRLGAHRRDHKLNSESESRPGCDWHSTNLLLLVSSTVLNLKVLNPSLGRIILQVLPVAPTMAETVLLAITV